MIFLRDRQQMDGNPHHNGNGRPFNVKFDTPRTFGCSFVWLYFDLPHNQVGRTQQQTDGNHRHSDNDHPCVHMLHGQHIAFVCIRLTLKTGGNEGGVRKRIE